MTVELLIDRLLSTAHVRNQCLSKSVEEIMRYYQQGEIDKKWREWKYVEIIIKDEKYCVE